MCILMHYVAVYVHNKRNGIHYILNTIECIKIVYNIWHTSGIMYYENTHDTTLYFMFCFLCVLYCYVIHLFFIDHFSTCIKYHLI